MIVRSFWLPGRSGVEKVLQIAGSKIKPRERLKPIVKPSSSATEPVEKYEIRVKGILSDQWTDWFDEMEIRYDGEGNTTLTGPVVDQAALHGLLDKVRDLGMTLLSVTRLNP